MTLSGEVHAPNGMMAFHRDSITDYLATLFSVTAANASLSGLIAVPDGTVVQLGKMSSTGTFSGLASTTVSSRRYTFNLTNLALAITSDLMVRVTNGAVTMERPSI